MAAVIEAAEVAWPRHRPGAAQALVLAEDAARRALARAGRGAGEVDILVNAGIYHDRNLGEPAVAALLQQDIGVGTGGRRAEAHGAFSFDLLNGPPGVLNAVEVIDGMIASGVVQLGMVSAADVDPDPAHPGGFRLSPAGGALLLSAGAPGSGFVAFRTWTFAEHRGLFEASVAWHPSRARLPGTGHGRNVLTVMEREGYLERSVQVAARCVMDFLESLELRAGDIDVLVPAHSTPGFADLLADAVGVARSRVPHLEEPLQRTHTVQPIARLSAAAGRMQPGSRVLLATAGAGLTVSLALYQAP